MRHIVLAALLAATAPAALAAPVPKEQLLKPPADAVHYVVASEAGKHGDQWRWQLPDGRTAYRWSQELRGWITEMDQVSSYSPDGTLQGLEIRGVTTAGDAAETFKIDAGKASWTTVTDKGTAPAGG